jgi:hypothetical protein
MRKVLIPAVVAAAIIGAVAAWFFFRQPNVYTAVPSSSLAVLRVNSWKTLNDQLQTTLTGNAFQQTQSLIRLQEELSGITSMLSADKALLEEAVSGNMLASLHLTSATDYDYLFVTSIPGINDNTILNNIQQVASVKAVSVRIFKGNKLLEVKLKTGRSITVAFHSGILMLSYTPFLTESALSALTTGENITGQKAFKKAMARSENGSEVKLYINFARISVILPVLVHARYAALFTDFEKAGEWGVFSLRFTNTEMRWSGALLTANRKTNAGNISLQMALPLLPAGAAVADVALNDTSTYGDDLTGSFFYSWAGNFRAFVTMEPLSGNYTEQNLLLIAASNEKQAQASLMNLLSAEGTSQQAVDTFMNRPVFKMKGGEMLNRFFGNQFCKMNQPYFTTMNGAVVFANNADVMKLAIENIVTGNTLYKAGVGIAKQSGTRWLYINPQRATALLTTFMEAGSTTSAFLNGFAQITVTAREEEDAKQVEVVFKTGSKASVTQGILWKLQLKTAAVNPVVFLNKATGAKEIFVQDTAGNVYVVNASGEILFSRYTGEEIVSGVEQVDYYHNGSYQYLFHSAAKVYLVDASGNDVAGYPLRLSSPATAGMTVWADEAKKTTRYFIPCANGGIYGYEITGKPVAGWSPRAGVGIIENPVTVFKQSGRDLLWACNKNGNLWLLDARGNKVWAAENMGGVSGSPAFVQIGDDFRFLSAQGNQLTTLNAEGNDNTIALMDSVTAFTVVKENDTSFLFVYASGNSLRSYDASGNFKNSVGLKSASITQLTVLDEGENSLLVAYDTSEKKLYLLNTSLVVVKEISSTNLTFVIPVVIFSTKEIVLIAVTNDGKLACIRS